MPNLFKTKDTPFVIAGPCSVESLDQLRSTTSALLASERVSLIRGGVWKPRSRPGGFEGLGEPALQWMAQLKSEMPSARFCCEVAQPEHVELCLQYGIDAVWIGARTTGNPFSVGELCSALKGSRLPVMIKNPLNPDVKLWIGAIERVLQAGTESVAAVHRGFYMYNNYGYRNNPLWEIPIELMRAMPDVPIFCDPSHIGGKRKLLSQLMQTALDLHFDGLMVEVHPSPSCALTDANQQITPNDFLSLLAGLSVHSNTPNAPEALQVLREQIDFIDSQLIHLIGDRLNVAKKIASVKAANDMAVFQPKRWEEVLEKKMQLALEQGIDPEFIKELYEKLHAESVKVQVKQLEDKH